MDARFGPWTVATDQKKVYGGEETAPDPFQVFLASIAACAGVYALNFCHARSIETDGLALSMHYDRHPKSGMLERIELRLTLPAGFPDAYRAPLVRAVDKCTVKRHLVADLPVRVLLFAPNGELLFPPNG